MNASILDTLNEQDILRHQEKVQFTRNLLSLDEPAYAKIIHQIESFQVAVPSWALGTGGTRFGRFPSGGEPRNLEEKIEDVGVIHHITRATNSISLHIPWDIPKDPVAIHQLLKQNQY